MPGRLRGIDVGIGRRAHAPGLLWRLYQRLRGTEQILVRPTPELPLVVIAFTPRERIGAADLRGAITETWRTIPEEIQRSYGDVLRRVPPMVVVLLRRTSPCTCLGHHHPAGTESHVARKLRAVSGVTVAELDLAYEAIRAWQPQPLSDLAIEAAVPAGNRIELEVFRYRLALLTVFLHELQHYACPGDAEHEVRSRSNRFYMDVLNEFMQSRFGVPYGLRE